MKTFSEETKRRYNIIFNTRDLEVIREDYFAKKWISKEELHRLFRSEQDQVIAEIVKLHDDYNALLNSFNLNALSSYTLLERQQQGKIKSKI